MSKVETTTVRWLVVMAAALGPLPPAHNVQPLTLATWNITYLSTDSGTGQIRRNDADYERLRAYASTLGADLVALQEVDGALAASRLFDEKEWRFYFAGHRPNRQGVGFAWRRGLKVTPKPDLEALVVSEGMRPGADIFVEFGEKRLRILNVHLKSGCQSGPLYSDQSDACETLRRQLDVVEDWMDLRASQGEAFVVMGDFNRALRPHDPAWPELDDADPPESDLTNPGAVEMARCWNLGWVDFIDHIVLSYTAASWLKHGSFRQVLYRPEDRPNMRMLSDHCPVVISLQ